MPELVRVEISTIVEKIISVLKSRKEVVGAYLFGSILGRCRPESDIDVGLLLKPDVLYSEKEAEKIQEEILQELPPINKHPFDIIILNRSSAIFAYRVIAQGRLIFVRDLEAVTDFMEMVSRLRAENYPRYRRALEEIARR